MTSSFGSEFIAMKECCDSQKETKKDEQKGDDSSN